MSSEPATAQAGATRTHRRLHSLLWRYQMRIFALLLLADVGRVFFQLTRRAWTAPGTTNALLEAGAFLLLAYFLWFHSRTIFATDLGIEVHSHNSVRVISWDKISAVRELSLTWLDVPGYPKRFELDLANGDVLEFVGRRNARALMRVTRPRQPL